MLQQKILAAGFTNAHLARLMNITEKQVAELIGKLEQRECHSLIVKLTRRLGMCPVTMWLCALRNCDKLRKKQQAYIIELQKMILEQMNCSGSPENINPN